MDKVKEMKMCLTPGTSILSTWFKLKKQNKTVSTQQQNIYSSQAQIKDQLQDRPHAKAWNKTWQKPHKVCILTTMQLSYKSETYGNLRNAKYGKIKQHTLK
jgi:hypothetical protein